MKLIKVLFLTLIFFSCSSKDDDCTKTISIPQIYSVDNQTFSYSYINQEVPCDVLDNQDSVVIEPPKLDNFTYEVLNFNYTPDTGNNTSRLQFEIKLNNNNNTSVNGFPYFTLLSDGIEFSTNYGSFLIPPCNSLDANSSCTVLLELEENHGTIGFANSIQLLDVKYYLTD